MGEHLGLRQQPFDQHLDPPAGRLVTMEARRDHAGIVENKQIAGTQQIGQLAEAPVDRSTAGRHVQQAAVTAPGAWTLRYQLVGQLVVEIAESHGRAMLAQPLAAPADGAILRDFLPGWWNW